ncbi:MAG: 3-deoxy-manno-octulosonate cytidylyltransferase [Planctomycetota bacterium]
MTEHSNDDACRVAVIIPARLASTRLPEKLLRQVAGRSILEHTFRQAIQSQVAQQVIIAVDHERLFEEVQRFGGQAVMTPADCASGTDRLAVVAEEFTDLDAFVNVQGDEPEIEPSLIDAVARRLVGDPSASMSTAVTPIRQESDYLDPNCVKAVLADDESAIYFSRSPLPHVRDGLSDADWAGDSTVAWQHIGIYAYRREFLTWFSKQPTSTLENLERLEQLRAIEAGHRIVVEKTETATLGIDTQSDLDAFAMRQSSGISDESSSSTIS